MKKPNVDVRFLDKKETYSLMLSAIYAAEADPNYRLLADLMYLLDDEEFKGFLTLFEGQTITIPTLQQLTEMLKALTIYTYRNVQGLSWKDTAQIMGEIDAPSSPYRGNAAYRALIQAIQDHNLNVGGIFNEFRPGGTQDLN